MGVQGLWDIVNKTGQSRSLASLAVIDGFEKNKSGKRGYRIGIDASIWYNHASFSKGGDNPELRLLFFRLRSLAELPLLPLFVFDGGRRPGIKRGSRMGKSGSHGLTTEMKTLLSIFGMEWRLARGEAEAELAYLNRAGFIDAVMTDDVDALVFGAVTLIKNPSLTLSGNASNPALNSDGKPSKHHVTVYTADAVRTHPEVSLTRGGLILFALLSGGDYEKGVEKFGKGIAHALARCGFGDELLTAFKRRAEQPLQTFLPQWRARISAELHSNSRGFLSRSYPSLSLPPTFPDLTILGNYANPVCSASEGKKGGGSLRELGDLSLPRAAAFCEEKFGEWGHASAIIKRFRDLLWEAAVMRVLRRAALEADEREREKRLAAGIEDRSITGPLRPSRAEAVGTPASLATKYLNTTNEYRDAFVNRGSQAQRGTDGPDANPLIVKIAGMRKHVSTDGMLEYRVEVCPVQFVALARSGIKGTRPEPPSSADNNVVMEGDSSRKTLKKPPPDPASPLQMWIPVTMMRQVHPGLVEDYEIAEEMKRDKKVAAAAKGKGKARAVDSDDEGSVLDLSSSPVKTSRATATMDLNWPGSSQTGPRREALTGSQINAPTRGFLCTFANPDDPSAPDEFQAGSESNANVEAKRNTLPTGFDAFVDRLFGSPPPSSRSKPKPKRVHAQKAAPRRRAPRATAIGRDNSSDDELPRDRANKVLHTQSKATATRLATAVGWDYPEVDGSLEHRLATASPATPIKRARTSLPGQSAPHPYANVPKRRKTIHNLGGPKESASMCMAQVGEDGVRLSRGQLVRRLREGAGDTVALVSTGKSASAPTTAGMAVVDISSESEDFDDRVRQPNVYPVPSSSQDSGLYDVDIVDLT